MPNESLQLLDTGKKENEDVPVGRRPSTAAFVCLRYLVNFSGHCDMFLYYVVFTC